MEKTAEKLKVNESLLKTVLCSATFWGLLAHGMVLFNKYSFHDDVRYFNEVGATYESGRWMLGILGSLSANLLGSKNYSLPVVNGTITILCIAAIVYLLVDSLKIQSKPLVILLCGSMVTFPSVTGTFSYMFTAPYYYAASLLGVVGAWISLFLNEMRSAKVKKVIQTVSFLPYFISMVAFVSLVTEFLSPSTGLSADILKFFGKEPIYFLGDAKYFRTIMVFSGIWQTMGYSAIVYLSALTAVDVNLYEAAMVDGANRWNRLIHITIPCIMPTIVVMFILRIGSLINANFEKIYLF